MNDKSNDEESSPHAPAKKAVAKKAVAKKAVVTKDSTGTSSTTSATTPVAKPAVKARRPLSKDEYVRTTKQAADSTSVIPAIQDDVSPVEPAAAELKPDVAPELEATQNHQAIEDDIAAPAPVAIATAVAPVASTEVHAVVPDEAPAAVADTDKARRRKLRRKLSYIEPWSVTKMAFVISVAMMIVLVVAVVVFWFVLQITGVWQALNDSIVNVLSDGSTEFDVNNYVGLARITGLALIVSAFNVVFFTALATISAHLYNLAASLMGGVEVTFEDGTR